MKKVVVVIALLYLPISAFSVRDYLPTILHKEEVAIESIMPKVAVIYLDEALDFKKTANNLVSAAKNKEILGIVLIINNFGGSVGAYSVIHDLIKKVSTIKPVISLICQGAYSCGYMVASASTYIFAHSLSDVGNIGVLSEITRYKNPKVKTNLIADMNVELLQAGEFKTLHMYYAKDLLPHEKEYLQDILDQTYQKFLEMVARNRNLDITQYKEWAEGKTFIAPEALRLGLIDEIGTIFDVQQKMLSLITKKNSNVTYSDDIEFVVME